MKSSLKQKVIDALETSLEGLKTINELKMFCNDHVIKSADQVIQVCLEMKTLTLEINLIYNRIKFQRSKELVKFRELVEKHKLLYEKQKVLYKKLLTWKEMYDELNRKESSVIPSLRKKVLYLSAEATSN